ncbi:MAG: YesL family protein [Clostridia bacterium]|nr:YesL family protein [Clostridia bacterium]
MGLFSQWQDRYNRPGPGVDKNAPQKKSFVVFFEILGRKFWKLCIANLLYLVAFLPILTRGLADVGLANITRSYAREKHAFIGSDFLETIKKNWKQALPVGIINNLLTVVIVFAVSMYYQPAANGNTMAFIGLALTMSVYVVFTVMKYYVPFLLITFKYNLRQLYRNALLFVGVGWKPNLVVSLVLLLCYGLMGLLLLLPNSLGIAFIFIIYLFVFPAFRSFLIQFAIFPTIRRVVIDPYYEKHPYEDIEKRRELGLEVPETENEEKEESIFVDRGRTKPEDEKETAKAKSSIPRQYTEAEMRRLENRRRAASQADDDDTI